METLEIAGHLVHIQRKMLNKNIYLRVFPPDGTKIVMKTKYPEDLAKKRALMNKFYREEMEKKLESIVPEKLENMNLSISEYRIKNMKTRWGTCNINKRRIWLSLKLAKKDPFCLEYVVVHELCHLLEKGHNKRFYAFVQKYLPNWKKGVRLLKE